MVGRWCAKGISIILTCFFVAGCSQTDGENPDQKAESGDLAYDTDFGNTEIDTNANDNWNELASKDIVGVDQSDDLDKTVPHPVLWTQNFLNAPIYAAS